MTANLCPWKSTWLTKMVKLWLRHIDNNSPRHPHLFETKPFVLSLIKKCYSSDECNFRNNTYALYKLMLSLLWEGQRFCDFAQAKIPNLVFWGGKNTESIFWFELPIRVSLSGNILSITLSIAKVACTLFQFRCSSIPNSLDITFPSSNLSSYVWFCHLCITNKWKFSIHFFK